MDIQTELMRETSEREIYVIKRDNGKFSAIEYVNHPTPSGSPRYLPTYEDNREWETIEKAREEFQIILNQINKLRATAFGDIGLAKID